VAKAGRKHTAAAQRSKCRSPNQQTVVHATSNPRFWELGSRDELEALKSRRERKERAYDLIATRYDKTPLQKRQWDKLLDIAAECARTPGTTEIDNEKRDQMVDFLCRAIYRGEIKDDKGRMRVLYLDPSPLASKRLDLNNRLSLNDFRKLFKIDYLLIRRKEWIACFSRNNVEFPKAWLPSELTGPNTQDTPNEMPPAALPSFADEKIAIEPPKRRRKRGEYHKPQGDRIDAKLKQLFPPDGKPPTTTVNSDIYQAVEKEFKNEPKGNALGIPSRRSILRRAGRSK
jgi:hypothetical protein